MPLVVSHQNCIHVSTIDDVEREMPIARDLLVFFFHARDLARKYLASHCLNLIDQGMYFKIANVG